MPSRHRAITQSNHLSRGEVTLERALSKLGLATRSEARALIAAGRVAVDGRATRDPLQPVVPERAAIRIDGQPRRRPDPVTIALHKPRGVVTTRRDPQGRPTVYDLLTDLDAHVIPVGRLDLATSGLLLMTNDTRLADWLTDPANAVPRIYLVTVRGRVSEDAIARLLRGVRDRGEHLRARSVVLRKASARESHLVVEVVEGRNREVRRLMEAIDHEVTALRRVQFGDIRLSGIAPGQWRRLSRGEIARAFPNAPQRVAHASEGA
jgi:23S rRNA pseudouridine2605 synthase